MGFDEDENTDSIQEDSEDAKTSKSSKTFFGLGLSNAVVYTLVIILALVFIRQLVIVLQAL